MDAKYLKSHIFENSHIETILVELGIHSIKWRNGNKYLSGGMPDGDNPVSLTVYNDEHINVVAYTRKIKDVYGNSDIISLVCFIRKCYFSQAIKWLCDIAGLDYYHNDEAELPESIKWTRQLLQMNSGAVNDDDEANTLTPINPVILTYYNSPPILQWLESDGILLEVQSEFEIGFDLQSERITIPIYDDIGNLVGVKGRLYADAGDDVPKYMYLERCAKASILYGLHKAIDYIALHNSVIVCESEKGVLQLWSHGHRNAVSIGGHTLSKTQVEKLTRLGVSVILAFDKDVTEADVLSECAKFIKAVDVQYIMDKDGLLADKESPMDCGDKFGKLFANNKYSYIRW